MVIAAGRFFFSYSNIALLLSFPVFFTEGTLQLPDLFACILSLTADPFSISFPTKWLSRRISSNSSHLSVNFQSLTIDMFCLGRSLQPEGLAETLCGSPLYMAPEIMQLQKYDAKVTLTFSFY